MIFSTKVLIEMLCATEVILIDGTFKTRPMMFAQVYVVIGKHLEDGVRVCFVISFLVYVCTYVFQLISSYPSSLVSHFEENGRSVQTHLQSAQKEGRELRLSANTSTCLLAFRTECYECIRENSEFE